MQINNTFADPNSLKPGDVLLCYCDPSSGIVARKIADATSSEYCHAAICYGDGQVAESVAKNGITKGEIQKTPIEEFLGRYRHVAVLRQPDAWVGRDRVQALRLFIDTVISNRAKYNFSGVLDFKDRKELHESTVHDKLEKFFSGELAPSSSSKGSYFCSEFVCDCFIAVGFIHPSAAILFQSDTYSPGDLGKEPAFGTFWGYLSSESGYTVEESDAFYRATPYAAIFGA